MTDILAYLERGLRLLFQQQFRVPRAWFWAAAVGGFTAVFFVGEGWPLVASLVVALVGVVGVARWRWHRRGTTLLLVARPAGTQPNDLRGRRAQVLLLEQLEQRLSADEMTLVHALPAEIAIADARFADTVRRRLDAWAILVGRIDDRADGGWTSHVALIEQPEGSLTHLDPHTRDRLASSAAWDVLASRLTSTRNVEDVPEPLVYGTEIEAFVRGFQGHVAAFTERFDDAERRLRDAIACAADSKAAAIDDLRCALARALSELGRNDDALTVLRDRAAQGEASTELLRELAAQLSPVRNPSPSDDDRAEATAALEQAAQRRSDPKRAMTLYNLSQLSTDPERAEALVSEAMQISRTYERAWYVHKQLGAIYFKRSVQAVAAQDSDLATEAARDAARSYARALRLRPRLRLSRVNRTWRWLPLTLFPRSPVMLANLADAQFCAGVRRGRWTLWRCHRLRRSYMRRGNRHARNGRWDRAYAWWDWAVVGYDDVTDIEAQTKSAIARRQYGDDEAADEIWADVLARSEFAMVVRYVASEQFDLARGVPGPEDNSAATVQRIVDAAGDDARREGGAA